MYKHLHAIPAVVVLFFELEWDADNWQARQAECARTIKETRCACVVCVRVQVQLDMSVCVVQ